jgi:anti-sigma factor RsiW
MRQIMNCSEAEELILSLLAQRASAVHGELAEHLIACQACEARYAPLLAIASSLQHLPDKELPVGFDARFRGKLSREPQNARKKAWLTAVLSLAAYDEVRWILVPALSIVPVAAALANSPVTPRCPLLISASNIGAMAVSVLLAAGFVHAVHHSDIITGIFRRKTR